MKTVCRVAATVGALAAQAARVGDDESMYANSTIAEPDEEKTKKLNKWLNDNTLPSGDQEKMDGSVDDPIWAYMKSDCFQGRYRTAVKYMSQKKCKTAIEVGGYLTPLDKFILEAKKEGKGKGDSDMPTKYVNIDPSMKEGKVEKNDGLMSYHLPMTLADFFSSETESLRKEMGIKADPSDTCVLIFGIWDPHYKNDEDKAAMGKLMKNSLWAAVETSEYAKNWLETSAKVCEKMGMTHVKDEDADCREALKGQKPDTSILRHMKFFERKEGKKDTKETSKDSDDEDSDDPKPIKKGGKKNTKKTSKDDDDDVDSLASEESEDDESSAEEADEEASSKKEGKAKDSLVSDETEDEETEAAEMTSDEEEEATNKKREKESSDSEEGESEKEADSSEDEEEASSKKSKKAKDESEDEEADASEESSEADSEAEESETEEDDAEDEEDEASSKKSKKISKH